MPTRDDIFQAIRNADAAGDSASVQKLAAYLQTMGGPAHDKAAADTAAWAATINPTDGMNEGEKFRAGWGKSVADIGRGLGQMVGAVDRNDVAESRQRDAALMNTGAGMAGNIMGMAATLAPTAMVGGGLGAAAGVGAATGLAQPSTSTKETLMNTGLGAVAGPAAVLGGRVLGAAYQGGKALVEPFYAAGRDRIAGRVLQEFASDPAAVAAAGGKQGPSITGSRPTLAESSKDEGIAALQASLADQDPKIAAMLAQRGRDNNAARVGVVQRLAGDDATRSAAVASRDAASKDAYTAATQANYTVDPQLADLLSRPAVKQALDRAKTMAANQGRQFGLDVKTPDFFMGTGKVADTRQISGQGLQDLKMAMDEMLTDPASGFVGKSGDTVKALRGQIVGWMEQANPAFKQARTAYAEASKPINAMDVGQRLLDKTTANVRDLDKNPRLGANAFSRAMNDEQSLVRQATGFKGANALEDVLTPQQQAGLNAVRDELETNANLASAANGPGARTAKALASQNLLRQLIGPTGMPQSWAESALLQNVMRPAQFAMKTAEPKIQNRLADIALNPEQAAAVMQMARVLPLSSRLGMAAEPYLPQLGSNALADTVARRRN